MNVPADYTVQERRLDETAVGEGTTKWPGQAGTFTKIRAGES